MNGISTLETKLTRLQELILIELNKTFNAGFICKKLALNRFILSKSIGLLKQKELIEDDKLTDKGKKMVHYLEFKNETISLFLNRSNLPSDEVLTSQLTKLDYKLIIALRNLL